MEKSITNLKYAIIKELSDDPPFRESWLFDRYSENSDDLVREMKAHISNVIEAANVQEYSEQELEKMNKRMAEDLRDQMEQLKEIQSIQASLTVEQLNGFFAELCNVSVECILYAEGNKIVNAIEAVVPELLTWYDEDLYSQLLSDAKSDPDNYDKCMRLLEFVHKAIDKQRNSCC